jgi:hypothetical protein
MASTEFSLGLLQGQGSVSAVETTFSTLPANKTASGSMSLASAARITSVLAVAIVAGVAVIVGKPEPRSPELARTGRRV